MSELQKAIIEKTRKEEELETLGRQIKRWAKKLEHLKPHDDKDAVLEHLRKLEREEHAVTQHIAEAEKRIYTLTNQAA